MPRLDKTGPQGLGSMTGRRMGNCAGNENTGVSNDIRIGRGFGKGNMGNGPGRGLGRFRGGNPEAQNISYNNEQIIENEMNSLKEKLAYLEKQLSDVRKQDKG